MVGIIELRRAIRQVFENWENYPSALSKFRIVGVCDEGHDRYSLHHIDEEKERSDSNLMTYLEIRDGKIWILKDNTEEGIAPELVTAGVPKEQIVLGFYPPLMREMGEFAIA